MGSRLLGPVAQRQSRGLLILWFWVRIPAGSHACTLPLTQRSGEERRVDTRNLLRAIAARATPIVVAATIIAGVTTAGFALALDSGTISACVNSASGTIRIATADQSCMTNEQRLTWNQQGPQ